MPIFPVNRLRISATMKHLDTRKSRLNNRLGEITRCPWPTWLEMKTDGRATHRNCVNSEITSTQISAMSHSRTTNSWYTGWISFDCRPGRLSRQTHGLDVSVRGFLPDNWAHSSAWRIARGCSRALWTSGTSNTLLLSKLLVVISNWWSFGSLGERRQCLSPYRRLIRDFFFSIFEIVFREQTHRRRVFVNSEKSVNRTDCDTPAA